MFFNENFPLLIPNFDIISNKIQEQSSGFDFKHQKLSIGFIHQSFIALKVLADLNNESYGKSSMKLFKDCFVLFCKDPLYNTLEIIENNLNEENILIARLISKFWENFFFLIQEIKIYHKKNEKWNLANVNWNDVALLLTKINEIFSQKYQWEQLTIYRIFEKNKAILQEIFPLNHFYSLEIEEKIYKEVKESIEKNIRKEIAKIGENSSKITNIRKNLLDLLFLYIQESKESLLEKVFLKSLVLDGNLDKSSLILLPYTILIGNNGGIYCIFHEITDEIKEILKEEYQIMDELFNNQQKELNEGLIEENELAKHFLGLVLVGSDSEKSCKAGDLVFIQQFEYFDGFKNLNRKCEILTQIMSHELNKALYSEYGNFLLSSSFLDYNFLANEKKYARSKAYLIFEFQNIVTVKKAIKGQKSKQKYSENFKEILLAISSTFDFFIKKGFFFFELKPQNFLYDVKAKKVVLIDCLSENYFQLKDLANFTISKEFLVWLKSKKIEKFSDPKLSQIKANEVWDLTEFILYNLGKILEKFSLDFFSDNDAENILEELVDLLTLEGKNEEEIKNLKSEKRKKKFSIEDVIRKISILKKEDFEKKIDFENLAIKLKYSYENEPKNLGFKQNVPTFIEKISDSSTATHYNPDFFENNKDNERNLKKIIEEFCNDKEFVSLLLIKGNTDLIISLILQNINQKLLTEWKKKSPFPFYFDLFLEKNLEKHLKYILKTIKFNQSFSLKNSKKKKNYPLILFIDHFDEYDHGIDSLKYLKEISDKKQKIIISCRKEYNEKFLIDALNPVKIQKIYLNNDQDRVFQQNFLQIDYFKNREISVNFFSCDKFFHSKMQENFKKRKSQDLSFNLGEEEYINLIYDSIKYLVLYLFLTKKRYLKSKFEKINNDNKCSDLSKKLKNKFLSFFLDNKWLENDLEHCFNVNFIRNNIFGLIFVGFDLALIQNFLLAKVFLISLNQNKNKIPTEFDLDIIFSLDFIGENDQVLDFLSDYIKKDEIYNEKLLEMIYSSRSEQIVSSEEERPIKDFKMVAASNAISILSAAQISFKNKDLSKIRISKANLKLGNFSACDFRSAELNGVNLESCILDQSIFQQTSMKNINIDQNLILKMESPFSTCAFSNENKYIIVGDEHGTVKFYDRDSGYGLRKILGAYFLACCSPCKDKILAVLKDEKNKFYLLNSKSDVLGEFNFQDSQITCIKFSKEGTFFAIGTNDHKLIIFDDKTNKPLKTLINPDLITSLNFSNDCKRILVGFLNETACVWNIEKEEIIINFNSILKPNFSFDSSLVIGYLRNVVKLFDAKTGVLFKTIPFKIDIECFECSPKDHFFLVSYDIKLKLYDFKAMKKFGTIKNDSEIKDILFSQDGELFLISVTTNFRLRSSKEKILLFRTNSSDKWLNTNTILEISSLKLTSFHPISFLHDNCSVLSFDSEELVILDLERQLFVNEFSTKNYQVRCLAVPQKKSDLVAIGFKNGFLIIYSLVKGVSISRKEHDYSMLNVIAFSNNADKIVFGGDEGKLGMEELEKPYHFFEFKGALGCILAATFSKNDEYLLSGSSNKSILLWSCANKECLKLFSGNQDIVYSLAFVYESSFVSGSADNNIHLWDFSGELKKTFKGHCGPVFSLDFSEGEAIILSASFDKTIKIWSAIDGNLLKTLEGHNACVFNAKFSHTQCKGIVISSSSNDQTIRIWHLNPIIKDKNIDNCKHGSIFSVKFLENTKEIISGFQDGLILLQDSQKLTEKITFSSHNGPICAIDYCSSSNRIISASYDKTIKLWNKTNGKLLQTFIGHENAVLCVCFSHKSEFFVSSSKDKQLILWDVLKGEIIKHFKGHESDVHYVQFSLDDKKILSCSKDKTLKLWDISTGNLIATLVGHSDFVYTSNFSHNYPWALSSSKDRTIIIWDLTNNNPLRIIKGHLDSVLQAKFANESNLIISVSKDKTLRIWCSFTGNVLKSIEINYSGICLDFTKELDYIFLGTMEKCLVVFEKCVDQRDLEFNYELANFLPKKNEKFSYEFYVKAVFPKTSMAFSIKNALISKSCKISPIHLLQLSQKGAIIVESEISKEIEIVGQNFDLEPKNGQNLSKNNQNYKSKIEMIFDITKNQNQNNFQIEENKKCIIF